MELEGAPSTKGTLLLSADIERMRMDFPEQTHITIVDDSWSTGRAI